MYRESLFHGLTHISTCVAQHFTHMVHACIALYMRVIKTHDSESRGQEAGRTRRTSELFTRSTALKFVNALNKPP